jgi:hypothetical protein
MVTKMAKDIALINIQVFLTREMPTYDLCNTKLIIVSSGITVALYAAP